MSETTEGFIAGLMVPLRDKQLLVPNVSVAELIGYESPELQADTPDWYLGTIIWRDVQIPLVSFEAANGESYDVEQLAERTIVFNGISGRDELPFYAVAAEGIPHAVRVGPEDAVQQEGELGECTAMMVHLSGEDAIIPDLDHLESMILALGTGS